MLLIDTITVVLRETLEAGTLIAVMLSITSVKKLKVQWLWVGIILGSVLAYVYSLNFEHVTEWFDYSGQELLNVTMQITTSTCVIVIVVWLIFGFKIIEQVVPILLTLIIVLLLTRELTEIIIFYSGFFQTQDDWFKGITSGFIGLAIGTSIGVISYATIGYWGSKVANRIQIVVLTMVSGGLVVQALQLLMQIDWISSTQPVWDSNWLIQESSMLGQMAYAVFGYEATPTIIEIIAYVSILTVVFLMLAITKYFTLNEESSDAL